MFCEVECTGAWRRDLVDAQVATRAAVIRRDYVVWPVLARHPHRIAVTILTFALGAAPSLV